MDLINRASAINAIVSISTYEDENCIKNACRNSVRNAQWIGGIKDAIEAIECVNPVDAAPVVHGRWVMDEEPHDGDVRCSVCLVAINQMHERNHGLLNALTGGKWYTFYSFCPQCGARMDGKEE